MPPLCPWSLSTLPKKGLQLVRPLGELDFGNPEVRDAFSAVIARAVDTSGHDYGSVLPMKDVK
jgi:hypothetical protein